MMKIQNNLKIFLLVTSFFLLVNLEVAAQIAIVTDKNPNLKTILSAEILQSYLSKMMKKEEFTIRQNVGKYDYILLTSLSNISEKDKTQLLSDFPQLQLPAVAESYSFTGTKMNEKSALVICGYDDRGLLYGVYDTLEKLGCRFYLSYDFVPEITEAITSSYIDKIKRDAIRLNAPSLIATDFDEQQLVFEYIKMYESLI